jgi:hypothetical protein
MENEKDYVPIEEVEDNSEVLDACELAVCMPVSKTNIERIPPMWQAEIGYGECAMCGTAIFFRTNMPKHLTKACFECAMEVAMENGDPTFVTRKSGADELREYLKKKEAN